MRLATRRLWIVKTAAEHVYLVRCSKGNPDSAPLQLVPQFETSKFTSPYYTAEVR
ncbi:MAG: hypothetical protein KatS3mg114_0452 [Planctomycetaceae bacterium]|nr:MAG: hypothetical protein KatS3mg114_0452 [Planctomycetaceae bacterium]